MIVIEFSKYRKKGLTEMRPWTPAEDMTGVSVSDADRGTGSPQPGDMIARNPVKPEDRWLVAEDYFRANYEAA